MIKAIVYLAVALSAFGIYMGVIQVTFHADKLGTISAITQGIGSWQDASAKAQYYGIIGKRNAELYFASSIDKKFTLDIAYVQADAKNLGKALDAKAGVNVVVLKATMLTNSVMRAKDEMKNVSKDQLAKTQTDALKAFADAQIQLDRLKGMADSYKKAQVQLDKLSQ